ncbi:lysylphosphatidylglycerol synthase domain-containing protein [Polyangium sp. y55x31]|uniref:lysylphosphatidylglycerol synthase domain-containing protein n=1 Tax=Polyangium sp. y55x31 TaxID=3042688 RepID=UPI002482A773|nr:lysylphosphatidylglycerol synthase domain-containing protein [Polyangium sp. y55x31]MDI1481644.1 lysylphosphatidylglycerol synthase domain-containing protein [Polyangium sp. y55x31]
MAEAPPRPEGERPRSVVRAVLPFVVSIALVAFVLLRLDLRAFREHLARVSAPSFLAFAAVFVVSLCAADSLATVLVYRRSVAPIRFRDFFILRGASYLPSLVNHHVGQAFITVALSRIHGVPLARVAGATLLVYASWMGSILGLSCIAIVLDDKPLVWLAIPLGAGSLYLALLAIRPARLVSIRLLAPLFEAGVRGHLFALFARLPHLVVLFVGTWVPFWFFGVRIPPGPAFAFIPVLMVAVTLPITPQGFGTRDVLAATLLEPFAPFPTKEARLAAIAASTTSWGVAITLIEIVFALVLLRFVTPIPTTTSGGLSEARPAPGRPEFLPEGRPVAPNDPPG